MLLTGDFDGLVIKNNIKTMRLTSFDDTSATLTVWWWYNRHELVEFCARKGRRGIENLALIPGSVWAAPIQNIGAYGVEVESVIKTVKWFDLTSGNIRALNHRECHFAYRDSVFKHELKDKFFITHVTFVFSKEPQPHLEYGALGELSSDASLMDIVEKICNIRASKLPSISEMWTAWSFFKNPIISEEQFMEIQQSFPDIKHRIVDGEEPRYKLAAGQLLELAWVKKGEKEWMVGTYENHCLVLVNHGEKSGAKIRDFAQSLQQRVKGMTGISLEVEVNII